MLAQDQEKSKDLIAKAFEKLEQLIHDVIAVKGQVEHAAFKEQIKWPDLRKISQNRA
jgi:hypothetical protein